MMGRLIAFRLALRGLRTDDLRVVLGYDEAVARANRAEMERDQLKASLAEVLAVFDTVKSTETGEILGHLVPAGVIHPDDFARWRAAFDQTDEPPATCICHPAKKPSYGCRIHGWAATRDQPASPT